MRNESVAVALLFADASCMQRGLNKKRQQQSEARECLIKIEIVDFMVFYYNVLMSSSALFVCECVCWLHSTGMSLRAIYVFSCAFTELIHLGDISLGLVRG
jgi:hypothetical protein